MTNRKARWVAQGGFVLAVLLLTACGKQPSAVMHPVTTINGEVPLGKLEPMHNTSVMIDTITAEGKRLLVQRGTRRAGTRAGIHMHEHGGHTCVESGAITDFVEGKPSNVYRAGSCYYMPPMTPMAAANLGAEDAILQDTFILPPGAATITILEPGVQVNGQTIGA